MTISVQTALSLAQTFDKPEKISELLQAAKNIFDQNNSSRELFPFSQQDINFQIILEDLNLTQRECDIIYLTNFFSKAYSSLNISWYICKNVLSDVDKGEIFRCHECLCRLNLDVNLLLCNSLKGKIKEVLKEI